MVVRISLRLFAGESLDGFAGRFVAAANTDSSFEYVAGEGLDFWLGHGVLW